MTTSVGTYETLDISVEDNVARVALNRPDSLNAINMVL